MKAGASLIFKEKHQSVQVGSCGSDVNPHFWTCPALLDNDEANCQVLVCY
jgi:hypothetical protein